MVLSSQIDQLTSKFLKARLHWCLGTTLLTRTSTLTLELLTEVSCRLVTELSTDNTNNKLRNVREYIVMREIVS